VVPVIGARLVPYEAISSIGARGMCEVCRTRDMRPVRNAATKALAQTGATKKKIEAK
jgi:hypothetical protein